MRCRGCAQPPPNAAPASRIAPSAVAEPRVREEEVDEARAGDLGALDARAARAPSPASSAASSRGGLPARAGELQRRVRRVVAVLGIARPLERDAGAERPASAVTGSAANGLAACEEILETLQLLGRADADDHVARLDHGVGLRRRVERAVALAQRDDDRARSRAGRGSRGSSCPRSRTSSCTSISAMCRSGPVAVVTASRNDSHLRLQHEVRHRAAGGRVRHDDAVGAREQELLLGVLVGGARDDLDVGPHVARRERDVEVVGVVVRGDDEAAPTVRCRRARGPRRRWRCPRSGGRRAPSRPRSRPRGSRARRRARRQRGTPRRPGGRRGRSRR